MNKPLDPNSVDLVNPIGFLCNTGVQIFRNTFERYLADYLYFLLTIPK
jgi:hypothetical protein